jgi:hypothetical protein
MDAATTSMAFMHRRPGCVAVAACIFLASSAFVTAQRDSSTFRTIERGSQSSIDSARQVVVRTPAEWAALWHNHNYDKASPPVDFNREMVIGVFMGSRPTGGYSIQIVSVAERDGKLVVGYRETRPKPGAMTVQILTFPYHLVAVPKYAGEVVFERNDQN